MSLIPPVLTSGRRLAVACAVLPLLLASCAEDLTAAPSAPDDVVSDAPPVLQNLAVRFGPYDAVSGRAGDFLFPSGVSAEPGMDKVFFEFGATVAGPDGAKVLPTFEYRGLAPEALVTSMTDGEVVAVEGQGQDVEVRVAPAAGSTWLIIYDHLTDVPVEVGAHVTAGATLGKPAATWGTPSFEIQINHGASPGPQTYVCPLELVDPALLTGLEEQVRHLQADWETFRNRPTAYDEQAQVRPGCLYAELDDRGGQATR